MSEEYMNELRRSVYESLMQSFFSIDRSHAVNGRACHGDVIIFDAYDGLAYACEASLVHSLNFDGSIAYIMSWMVKPPYGRANGASVRCADEKSPTPDSIDFCHLIEMYDPVAREASLRVPVDHRFMAVKQEEDVFESCAPATAKAEKRSSL